MKKPLYNPLYVEVGIVIRIDKDHISDLNYSLAEWVDACWSNDILDQVTTNREDLKDDIVEITLYVEYYSLLTQVILALEDCCSYIKYAGLNMDVSLAGDYFGKYVLDQEM